MGFLKATIEDAKLQKISNVFKTLHKPKGLGFFVTDVITLKLRTSDGKTFNETFYCCLSADGKLNITEISKEGRRRQGRLAEFIKKYISRNKNYNIKENIDEWKGKPVSIIKEGKDYLIL